MNKFSQIFIGIGIAALAASVHAGGDPEPGKTKAAACVACHGEDGNSTNPQFPRLAGQYADYIERALTDYASGARKNPIMKGFASALSAQDRADLAAWFASQETGVYAIDGLRLD